MDWYDFFWCVLVALDVLIWMTLLNELIEWHARYLYKKQEQDLINECRMMQPEILLTDKEIDALFTAVKKHDCGKSVSYTHLTLPTNREV